MNFDSKIFDLERSLQHIRESRISLEHKTHHQMIISNELLQQNKNSLKRLISSLELQNQQAKERNIDLINEVLNDVTKLNIEKLNPKIKFSENRLDEAKRNYYKKLDESVALIRRSQSFKLENKINQIKSEKLLMLHRREVALQDYINEERLNHLLEKERRELININALENADLMKSNHSKYILSQEAKYSDNVTFSHLTNMASALQSTEVNNINNSHDNLDDILHKNPHNSFTVDLSSSKRDISLPQINKLAEQNNSIIDISSLQTAEDFHPNNSIISNSKPDNDIEHKYANSPDNFLPRDDSHFRNKNDLEKSDIQLVQQVEIQRPLVENININNSFEDSNEKGSIEDPISNNENEINDQNGKPNINFERNPINLQSFFDILSKYSWDFIVSFSKVCFEKLLLSIISINKIEEIYEKEFLNSESQNLSQLKLDIIQMLSNFELNNTLDPAFQTPKYLASFILSICCLKSDIILPKDIFTGVISLEKLKKELKKYPKSLIFWDSLISHLKSVINKFPSSSNFLSELFTNAFIYFFLEEEKDRIRRKLTKLLQLAILPDSNSPKKDNIKNNGFSYDTSNSFYSRQNKPLLEYEDEFMEESSVVEPPKMKVIQNSEAKKIEYSSTKENNSSPKLDKSDDEFDF